MAQVTIYLPDNLRDRIKVAGLNVSAICRTALERAADTEVGEALTIEQYRTALTNLQWLLRHRDAIYWPDVETVGYGDGGIHEMVLVEPGLTPAT